MSILNGRNLTSLLNLTGEQVCELLARDFLYFGLVPIFICGYTFKVACVEDEGICPVERRPIPWSEVKLTVSTAHGFKNL